jgi:isopentenyl-diphosphate delta-isomerase
MVEDAAAAGSTALRKMAHIDACLTCPVEYETRTTGLERVELRYVALPELDLDAVDTSTTFLGRRLEAPVLIGAMTGGTRLSGRINENLAVAAQALGVGLMLGSQRVMLEDPASAASFRVRAHAPDVLLLGNLGVAQLDPERARRAVEEVGADALALHTNPLQEAIQHGGDTDFRAVLERIARAADAVEFPLLLKEVGHGIGPDVAAAAHAAGVGAIDVAGAGGTSWARVEEFVRYGEVRHRDLAEWGIPTADAVAAARSGLADVPLVASGGIRSGLDAAKAIALGADVVAVALPLLLPAIESADAVVAWLEDFLWELRRAMYCSGSGSVAELRSARAPAP